MPVFGSPGREEEGMRKQEPAQQAEWLFPSVPSPMGTAASTVSLSLSPAPAEPSTALGLSLLAETAELGSGAPCPSRAVSTTPEACWLPDLCQLQPGLCSSEMSLKEQQSTEGTG